MSTISPLERRARARAIVEARRNTSLYNQYKRRQPTAVTPVNTEVKEKKKDNDNFFVRGLATVGDLFGNVVSGAVKGVEGIVDFGAGLVGSVGGIFSDDFQDDVQGFIERDYTSEFVANPLNELFDDSILKDGGIIEGVASGIGQMLPAVVVSIATAGLGAPAAVAQSASLATTAVSAAGSGTEAAYKDGAGYYQGLGYGAATGALEAGTEKLFGGATKNLFGKGVLDDAGKAIVGKEIADVGVKRMAKEALEEGAEEIVAELANPALKSIYKGKDAFSEYGSGEYWKGVGEAGVVGSLTGLVYSNTLGHGVAKITGEHTGKAADINDSLSAIENQDKLWSDGNGSPANNARIAENIKGNYKNIETVLKKAKDAKRAELIKKFSLEEKFEADGSMKVDFAASLELNNQAEQMTTQAGENANSELASPDKRYVSPGLWGKPQKINETLTNTTENLRRSYMENNKVSYEEAAQAVKEVKAFKDELTDNAKKSYSKLKKGLNHLNTVSGQRVNLVVTEAHDSFNAGLIDDTIYIGADTLENGSWAESLVHEYTHFAEGTKEYNDLVELLAGDSKLVEKTLSDIYEKSGYGFDKVKTKELLDRYNRLQKSQNNRPNIDSNEEIRYNRKYFKFLHKNFPPENESGSEAHRLAVWWTRQKDVQTGDRTLISYHDNWYLVEKFDDADNHYQVEEYLTKAEFKKIFKEIKEYGRSGRVKSVQGSFDEYDKLNQPSYSLKGRESGSDSSDAGYGREDTKVVRMASSEIERGERASSDGSGDSSSSSANQQGDNLNTTVDNEVVEELTEDELKYIRLYKSELGAHLSANLLGTESFIDKLVRENTTIAEKVLNKISDLKQMFERLGDAEARAEYKKIKKAEKLYLDAVEKAGYAYVGRKIIGAIEEREEEAKFSIKYPRFSENDISNNINSIAEMDSVVTIDAKKLERTGKTPKEIFNEYFDALGNNIASETFGDIALSKSSVKSEIRHGITAEKIASIEAIPAVIENGRVIFSKTKGGTDVERIVVAAPITIGTIDYYMGVMLQRDTQNQRLYLHNVVAVKAEEAVLPSQDDSLTNWSDESDSRLFITSILQKAINVKVDKQKFTEKSVENNSNIKSSNPDIRFNLKPEDPTAKPYFDFDEIRKLVADATKMKVYSRAASERIVDEILADDMMSFGDDYGMLSGKAKKEVVEMLRRGLNSADLEKRVKVVFGVAEYIINNGFIASPETDYYRETLQLLKPYFHNLELSNISESIGKDKTQLLYFWGKKGSKISVSEPAEKLSEMGYDISEIDETNLLIAIHDIYENAFNTIQKEANPNNVINKVLDYNKLKQLKQDIVQKLLKTLGEKGKAIESFQERFNKWDGKTEGFAFLMGEVPKCLSNLEVDGHKVGKKQVKIDASKVKKIMQDHPEMTRDVIKELPYLLNNPILILDSKTVKGSLVLFGEVYANGVPVMMSLEMNPTTRSGRRTYIDIIKVSSAYTRSNTQNIINTSNIRYKNENRVNDWLKVNRLQLPLPNSQSDSADNSIPENSEKGKDFDKKTQNNSKNNDVIVKSKGEYQKLKADYTKQKKYDKKEVSTAVLDIPYISTLPKATQNDIIESMWYSLNTIESDNQKDRFINMCYSRILRDLWQESNSFAELPADEIREIELKLHKTVRNIVKTGGSPTYLSKVEAKYAETQAGRWLKKYQDSVKWNELVGKLMNRAKKMDDIKHGTYLNATQYKRDLFKGSIEKLSRVEFRGNLNVTGTRKIVKDLIEWYNPENPIFKAPEGSNKKTSEFYDEYIADILDALANGDGAFSIPELSALNDVMDYFIHFIEHYNKVKRNGEYVEATPIAEEFIKIIRRNKTTKKVGWFRKFINKYMTLFCDNETVVRYMDSYEDGFYTTTFNNLREACLAAELKINEISEPLKKFYKENKKFLKDMETRTVKYQGHDIPLGEAMLFYMTLNREQAQMGLAKSGFSYLDQKAGDTIHLEGFAIEDTYGPKEIKDEVDRVKSKLSEQFTDLDKQYIALAEKIFNEECKKLKEKADIERRGYSNVLEGYYVPIRRGTIAHSVDSSIFDEMARTSNASFNKDTVKGAKNELAIEPLDVVLHRHIKGVALYSSLATCIDEYNLLFNLDVGGNANKPTSVKVASENTWSEGDKFFRKLISDIQGIPSEASLDFPILSKIRGAYAKYQLGANPKVWLTQLSSLMSASSILDIDCIIKGMGVSAKDVDEYCALAKLRNDENTAAMAQGVMDKVDKVGDWLMKPIGKVDRFVVTRLFGACQMQIQKNEGLKVGTEENKERAGELLKEVIIKTQQNSLATERSAAMRSGNEILKASTMFSADSMKVIGRVIDSYGELLHLKQKRKQATDPAEIAELDKKIKSAKRNARKSTSALISSAVLMALIAQLFRTLYNKEEEPEEEIKNTAVDFAGNLIGGLPILRDVYSKLAEGYDVDNYAYAAFNDLIDSVDAIRDTTVSVIQGKADSRDIASTLRKTMYSAGQVTGIPTRNLYNLVTGITRRVSPSSAYWIDDKFYKQSYSSDLAKAIERDDEDMIAMIAGLMLDENIGGIDDSSARKSLNELLSAGHDVLPRSVPEKITYEDEEITLSAREKKTFKNIYSTANESLASLVKLSQYTSATDEVKSKSVKFIYNVYYNLAVQDALGVELENKNVLFAEAIDIEKLALIVSSCRSLTADVDDSGKAISGSRKKKVQAFVNSLRLTAAQKYMIMGYLGYKNLKGEEQVKAFINRLNLTKTEKETLLKYSGY